jgi:hypothetical protein
MEVVEGGTGRRRKRKGERKRQTKRKHGREKERQMLTRNFWNPTAASAPTKPV